MKSGLSMNKFVQKLRQVCFILLSLPLFTFSDENTRLSQKPSLEGNVLREQAFPNGYHCETCFNHISSSSTTTFRCCSRCHHINTAHGVFVIIGKHVLKQKFQHSCPVDSDQKPFICLSYSLCPTGSKTRHALDLAQEKKKM